MRTNKKIKISNIILLTIFVVLFLPFICSYFTPSGRARILDKIRSIYIPRYDESGIYGYIFEYPIDPGMAFRTSFASYSNRPPSSISIYKVEEIKKISNPTTICSSRKFYPYRYNLNLDRSIGYQ